MAKEVIVVERWGDRNEFNGLIGAMAIGAVSLIFSVDESGIGTFLLYWSFFLLVITPIMLVINAKKKSNKVMLVIVYFAIAMFFSDFTKASIAKYEKEIFGSDKTEKKVLSKDTKKSKIEKKANAKEKRKSELKKYYSVIKTGVTVPREWEQININGVVAKAKVNSEQVELYDGYSKSRMKIEVRRYTNKCAYELAPLKNSKLKREKDFPLGEIVYDNGNWYIANAYIKHPQKALAIRHLNGCVDKLEAMAEGTYRRIYGEAP